MALPIRPPCPDIPSITASLPCDFRLQRRVAGQPEVPSNNSARLPGCAAMNGAVNQVPHPLSVLNIGSRSKHALRPVPHHDLYSEPCASDSTFFGRLICDWSRPMFTESWRASPINATLLDPKACIPGTDCHCMIGTFGRREPAS